MSEQSAQAALTSFFCRGSDCGEQVRGNRGPQSYCASCRKKLGIGTGGRSAGATYHGPAGSHQQRAREVQRCAIALDRALKSRTAATDRVRNAQATYQAAIIALGGSTT